MIHGAGQSAGLWRTQATHLAAVAEPVALNLPGHGAFDTGKGETSIAAYAQSVLNHIGDTSPDRVVLCGHSMGGAIVQYLLLHFPRSFTAGILVNTGARLRVSRDLLDRIVRGYASFVDYVYEQSVAAANQTPTLRGRFRQISACHPEVTLGDYLACDAFDAMKEIGHIRVPVLVVGSEEDRLTPLKYSTFLADTIPEAKLSIVPAAGHYSPLENPAALNRMMVDFLESLRMGV
jgi:pimeloyl-ACP methyl ester carboxylesterase